MFSYEFLYLETGYSWMWYFGSWSQLCFISWYILIYLTLNHRCRYTNLTTTHHLMTITQSFTRGGIHFLNNTSPIIVSPYSDFALTKNPSNCGFIEYMWSSLVGIWIRNVCIYTFTCFMIFDIEMVVCQTQNNMFKMIKNPSM